MSVCLSADLAVMPARTHARTHALLLLLLLLPARTGKGAPTGVLGPRCWGTATRRELVASKHPAVELRKRGAELPQVLLMPVILPLSPSPPPFLPIPTIPRSKPHPGHRRPRQRRRRHPSTPPPLLLPSLLRAPTTTTTHPTNPLLSPCTLPPRRPRTSRSRAPKNRLTHALIPLSRHTPLNQPEIIIQNLRVAQTAATPVLVDAVAESEVGLGDLGVQGVQLGGVDGRGAVVAVVEGEAGEGLEVGEVGVVAGGAEVVEGGEDLGAGVVEDPFAARWSGVAVGEVGWGGRG